MKKTNTIEKLNNEKQMFKNYSLDECPEEFIKNEKVLDIIISWSGCPIYGVAFGLFVGDDDGDNVKNIKFASPSTYLYLIAF